MSSIPSRIAKHLVMFQPERAGDRRVYGQGAAEHSRPRRDRRSAKGRALQSVLLSWLWRANPNSIRRAPVAEGFIAMLAPEQPRPADAGVGLIRCHQARPASCSPGPTSGRRAFTCGASLRPARWRPAWRCSWRRCRRPQYAGVDIYSRPNTEVGRRFNRGAWAYPGRHDWRNSGAECLDVPARDRSGRSMTAMSPHSGKKNIGITVARTLRRSDARRRHPQCRLYRRAGMPL